MSTAHELIRPYIGGASVEPHGTDVIPNINPATEVHFADIVDADSNDVDLAVQTAAEAQKEWVALAPGDRADALLRWGELLAAAEHDLSVMDTRDMGKPIRDGVGLGRAAYRMTQYWASNVDRMSGLQIPATNGYLSYTVREPVGVCGVIMPWNGPLPSFTPRVAPALACGNAVVIKPSEVSPVSAIRMAELTVEAGMPAGLVNVVTGGGATGTHLSAHPGVGAISFTGSPAVGRAVARTAADTFKRVVLELGGKAPNVVFADADLDSAIRASTWGVFANSGQVCVAGTRVLVERSIAKEFAERLAAYARQLRVGDPLDPTTQLGPVASGRQYERVQTYVAAARSEGAVVLTGGGRPAGAPERGFFIEPTVLSGVDAGMTVASEEIFGPVLSIIAFDTDDEALAIANSTEYGLSANVWTSRIDRMIRFATEIESGMVWGNTPILTDPALPFGGFKSSGINNAYGQAAVDGLTRLKRVSIRFDPNAPVAGWSDLR